MGNFNMRPRPSLLRPLRSNLDVLRRNFTAQAQVVVETPSEVPVDPPTPDTANTTFIRGSVLTRKHLDLARVSIGQRLDIPYEITVDAGWRDQWQASFYQQDRVHTSLEFCNTLGFSQIPLPNPLALFAASSMSHVDSSRDVYDLRIKRATYERPIYPLDTLKRLFVIQDVRDSRNRKNVIVDILCKMFNQHGQRVYSLVKTMMFTRTSLATKQNLFSTPLEWKVPPSAFKDTIMSKTREERRDGRRLGSHVELSRGDLLLHSYIRPTGKTSSMNLSTHHRMTHPRLFNTSRFNSQGGILVASPIMLAAAHASAAHDLYETYYESIDNAVFCTTCSPEDTIGAMTYIKSVKILPNDLEEVKCVTIGVKNVDVARQLADKDIPLDLFLGKRRDDKIGITPSEVEEICDKYLPSLQGKICLHSERTLVREQATEFDHFLL